MADDDEVIVKVEREAIADATSEQPVANGREPTAAAATEIPADDLAAQFEEMKEQRAQESAAAQRRISLAEQETQRARHEATTARSEVLQSRAETVETGLAAAQAEADAAEREYKTAFESADGGAMAAADRKAARAAARIERLSEAKADLESIQPGQAERAVERRTEPQQPVRSSDPIEAYVAGRPPQTAAWLRAHADYITDAEKNATLTDAHYSAMSKRLVVDTPAYITHIEQFLGIAKAPAATEHQQPQPRQRRPSVPAAPVSNSGGGMNGGGNEVRLTRMEANAATDGTHVWNYDDPSGKGRFKKGDAIGVQEFARRKLEMTRSGHYDRTYVEQ